MEAKMSSRYFCFVYMCIAVGGSINQDREYKGQGETEG
jgi:hypothetical protein